MTPIKSYKDLIVLQKAMELVIAVYKLTEKFPPSERYGLSAQMKRCSVSIPSNIAEGKQRGSRKDYYRFIIIAYSSGAELETQMEITKKLPFGKNLDCSVVENLLLEVMKMLNKIISVLKT